MQNITYEVESKRLEILYTMKLGFYHLKVPYFQNTSSEVRVCYKMNGTLIIKSNESKECYRKYITKIKKKMYKGYM